MLPNEAISQIPPIDSVWTQSSVSIPQIPQAETLDVYMSDKVVGIAAIVIILIFLIFNKGLISFLGHIFKFTASTLILRKTEKRSAFSSFTILMFIGSLPVCFFLLSKYGLLTGRFWWLIGGVALFFLIRALVLYVIGKISSREELFSSLTDLSMSFVIIATIVLTISFPFTYFVEMSSGFYIFRIVISVILILLLALYVADVSGLIFSSRAPLFLSILYLCTLEILPLSMAIVAVVRM